MQGTQSIQHLDAETARAFLDKLPEHIKQAFLTRAVEIDYPVEAVLESAIAASLDPDSLSFVDCKPMTGTERSAIAASLDPDSLSFVDCKPMTGTERTAS